MARLRRPKPPITTTLKLVEAKAVASFKGKIANTDTVGSALKFNNKVNSQYIGTLLGGI